MALTARQRTSCPSAFDAMKLPSALRRRSARPRGRKCVGPWNASIGSTGAEEAERIAGRLRRQHTRVIMAIENLKRTPIEHSSSDLKLLIRIRINTGRRWLRSAERSRRRSAAQRPPCCAVNDRAYSTEPQRDRAVSVLARRAGAAAICLKWLPGRSCGPVPMSSRSDLDKPNCRVRSSCGGDVPVSEDRTPILSIGFVLQNSLKLFLFCSQTCSSPARLWPAKYHPKMGSRIDRANFVSVFLRRQSALRS